ncbi:MAG: DUF523 domain-containing protein [Clostridiales bacterium]|nr:DUF523 domain-containing protein [Clostridiales bacterium]
MKNVIVSTCLFGIPCRYDGKSVVDETLIQKISAVCHPIPFCPEVYGGLTTPRDPAERIGDKVISNRGKDVTREYMRGAKECLRLAKMMGCQYALLKSRSPSCGKGTIYDGTFSGKVTEGDGVTAEILMKNGIKVFDSDHVEELLFALTNEE